MINISALAAAAAHYDTGDPRRVQHFIKVYGYCRLLGLSEGLDTHTQNMLCRPRRCCTISVSMKPSAATARPPVRIRSRRGLRSPVRCSLRQAQTKARSNASAG